MRTPEEINADCFRVTDLIALLVEATAKVGDNPLLVLLDDNGMELSFVEVNTDTGDVALIVNDPS
jgi:hypothetical protein